MPTTYYQSDVDGNGGWGQIRKRLLTTTSSFVDLSIDVPIATSPYYPYSFILEEGTGLLNWPTSSYGAQFDVRVLGSTTVAFFYLTRWNPLANSLMSSQDLATNVTGTGLKTYSGVTFFSVNDNASRATGDRFGLLVGANNSAMMNAEAFSLRVNTSDAYATAPWSEATSYNLTSADTRALTDAVPVAGRNTSRAVADAF